jgi:hypothetical protein
MAQPRPTAAVHQLTENPLDRWTCAGRTSLYPARLLVMVSLAVVWGSRLRAVRSDILGPPLSTRIASGNSHQHSPLYKAPSHATEPEATLGRDTKGPRPCRSGSHHHRHSCRFTISRFPLWHSASPSHRPSDRHDREMMSHDDGGLIWEEAQ